MYENLEQLVRSDFRLATTREDERNALYGDIVEELLGVFETTRDLYELFEVKITKLKCKYEPMVWWFLERDRNERYELVRAYLDALQADGYDMSRFWCENEGDIHWTYLDVEFQFSKTDRTVSIHGEVVHAATPDFLKEFLAPPCVWECMQ